MSLFGMGKSESKFNLFSVYDSKGQVYSPPFMAENSSDAKRAFMDAIEKRQGLVGMHPEDHSFVAVGCFVRYSGLIDPSSVPELVVTGLSVKAGFGGVVAAPEVVS